jgi:hypothetical protein
LHQGKLYAEMIFVTYIGSPLSFRDFCILPHLSVLFVMNVGLKHLPLLIKRKTVTNLCVNTVITTPFMCMTWSRIRRNDIMWLLLASSVYFVKKWK